jgi:hypothetical protein
MASSAKKDEIRTHDVAPKAAAEPTVPAGNGEDQMTTTKGLGVNGSTMKRLKLWEQEIIYTNTEVKRKATICQLCALPLSLAVHLN